MATLVCFHAHPDDESILTGGVMRQAADAGHRVVLVVATHGERGLVPDDLGDQTLGQRRVAETEASAALLGVARTEFLGYHDSGMAGDEVNGDPGNFWIADVEEAALQLVQILREENADVLIVYDDNGGYGHPDHIQVHRVGMRAADIAGVSTVYQATMNRDNMSRNLADFAAAAEAAGIELPVADDTFGKPEAQLTTAVDVRAQAEIKRASMRAHRTQITDQSFFLAMPEDIFARVFGTEWFIRVGAQPGIAEQHIL